MRAETQNSVDAIEKSLALLAQRMDYETSGHRLEEFNARVEDPTLWDDPAKAQKLMRDRQMLVDAVAGYEKIKTDLTDNIELIELGEMEEDAEVVAEAEAAIKKLEEFAAKKELEALLDGEADGNWRGCMSAGRKRRAIRSNCSPKHRAKRRGSSQRPIRSAAPMLMAG